MKLIGETEMRKFGFRKLVLLVVAFSLCLTPTLVSAQEGEHPLKGETIDMAILGIGGWIPSMVAVQLAQEEFAPYALENYGYTVNWSFQEAPFASLFQKAATSLATGSQEFNIIVSDSQWLGAFAEPGWIVNISDLIAGDFPQYGEIEWYDPVVQKAYQFYPDGTETIWGLPQTGDVVVLYVNQELLLNEDERAAFEAEYDWTLPATYEDWFDIDFDQFEQIAAFFTRPEEDLYGTAMQYSKEYDFMTMFLYPFMFSLGGDIWDPATGDVWGILNSDVNAQAMEINKRWLNYQPPGALNYGIPDIVDVFTQDKVFSGYQWAAMGAGMIPEGLEDKYMVVVPPGARQEDGSVKRVWSIGGQPWVINANNDEAHMRVVHDFLNWWYLPETQIRFNEVGGNPATALALNSEGYDDIQVWNRAYKDMLTEETARDFWHEPTYSEMLAVQQEGWTAFASGQVTDAKNTLDWIACQQQEILYDAGRTDNPAPDECDDIELD